MSKNPGDIPDLAADFAEEPLAGETGLPSLETLLDAFPAPDADTLESMIDIAVDPATADTGVALIPEDYPGAAPDESLDLDFSDLSVDSVDDAMDNKMDNAIDNAAAADPSPDSDSDPLAGWE